MDIKSESKKDLVIKIQMDSETLAFEIKFLKKIQKDKNKSIPSIKNYGVIYLQNYELTKDQCVAGWYVMPKYKMNLFDYLQETPSVKP